VSIYKHQSVYGGGEIRRGWKVFSCNGTSYKICVGVSCVHPLYLVLLDGFNGQQNKIPKTDKLKRFYTIQWVYH